MRTRSFRAMNTDWWIGVRDGDGDAPDLAALEAVVHAAERRYSRFRADSLLSRLNRERSVRDAELAALVARALEIRVATGGAFDLRVGAALRAAGYDRTFDAIAAWPGRIAVASDACPVAALRIDVDGDAVRLDGPGALDLGGIAKGWTVDRVAECLAGAGCAHSVVDGGGDIRAAGRDERGEPWVVGVAEGRALRIEDAAVCTSTTRRRRWQTTRGEAHHVIDPATGAPSRHDVVEAVVVARETAVADALATALIADPARGLASLARWDADAMFLRGGRWETTPGMRRRLT